MKGCATLPFHDKRNIAIYVKRLKIELVVHVHVQYVSCKEIHLRAKMKDKRSYFSPFTLEFQNHSDRSRTVSCCSMNVTVSTQTVFA